MKLHRYVDHQRLHIVTKDVISLSISVLLLFRHYISHKITFGAPSSGGVLRSACGAFIIIYSSMAFKMLQTPSNLFRSYVFASVLCGFSLFHQVLFSSNCLPSVITISAYYGLSESLHSVLFLNLLCLNIGHPH